MYGFLFSQTIEKRVGFYNDGSLGKIYIDTVRNLPYTNGKYFDGYGNFSSLADSINNMLTIVPVSKGGTGYATYDTSALASFGGGSGAAGDTIVFSTTALYGSFFNSSYDTLYITRIQVGLQGSSPSVLVKVWYNDSLNVTAGATALVTAGNTCTNTYTGTSITTFNNYKIPPGVWVWVATPTVTTKPTYFTLTLIGYKKRA